MKATVLVRIRFPGATVDRLDAMARDIGAKLGRKVARAAVIRAILHLLADKLDLVDVPGLVGLFELDSVRRGRTAARKAGAS